MIEEQLSNAGIIDPFDSYYSVDDVKKYKPFKDIYLSVSKSEGFALNEGIMVATHDWDLFGAKKAGLKTCYIKRKKQLYNPIYIEPDYSGTSLTQLMSQILTTNDYFIS